MKTIIKTPTYEMRCPYCGCHFTFEEEDIDKNTKTGSSHKYREITCPHCKNDVQVRDYNTHYLMPNVKVRFKDESNKNFC